MPPRLTSPGLWVLLSVLALLAALPRYLTLLSVERASTRDELTAVLGDPAAADLVAVGSVAAVAALAAVVLAVIAATAHALERRFSVRQWRIGSLTFGSGFLAAAVIVLPVEVIASVFGDGRVPPWALGYVALIAVALTLLLRPQSVRARLAIIAPVAVLCCLL